MTISRRTLLRTTGLATAALPFSKTALAACETTPAQTTGPFYPITPHPDRDTDLTRVRGRTAAASGQVVEISGIVRATSCGNPVAGALVEIWQACATGRYDHPNDTNSAPLDENFQYWGRTTTDAQGRYSFRTIKPGAYPANETWIRPPHIHFRVAAQGLPTLVTQLYFAGEELNETDDILLAVPSSKRSMVVVPFVSEAGILKGQFDLFLAQRLNNPDATPVLD